MQQTQNVPKPAQATAPINWTSTSQLKELAKELYREFSRDKVTTLAAAFAYHTVFAIPALLILLVLGAAWVNKATDIEVVNRLRTLIAEQAPANTQALLTDLVDNAIAQVGGGAISVGLILTAVLALWSGSNAIGSTIESFNLAYGVEEKRPFLKKKLTVLGLTLLLVVFVNVAFALLVFGRRIGAWIADWVGAGSAFDVIWNVLRWPIAIALIAVFLAILYYVGPNIEQSFRWISPGSIIATVLWLIATAGLGIYLRFSDPGSAYGAVGSLLVLLFFLYVTGIVFILGAELNALLGKREDPEVRKDVMRQ